VYPTAVDGEWVAISARDRVDLSRLASVIGRTDLPDDLSHEAFDAMVATWTQTLAPSEIVDAVDAQHIPAEWVLTAGRMYDIAQLDARGFYQQLVHPITGAHRYPGWPFRITPGPVGHHQSAPPTLGQHNDEILGGLGLDRNQLEALRRQRVIGEAALNT
jgi:crotonobetainyl-CoA:carnitine CoA-transferase CaiB-like acyl-CoA transferase